MKFKNSIILIVLICGGAFGLMQAYNWLHKYNKNEDNYYLQGPGKGDYLYLSASNFDNQIITKNSSIISQEKRLKIKNTKYVISQLNKKEQKINNSIINLNNSIQLMVLKIEKLYNEQTSLNDDHNQYDEQIKIEKDDVGGLEKQAIEIQNQMKKNQQSIDQTNSDRFIYDEIIDKINKEILSRQQNEIEINKNIEDMNDEKKQIQLNINLTRSKVESAKENLNKHNISMQKISESINYLDYSAWQLVMYDEDILKLQNQINKNNTLIFSKENLIKNQQQIIYENQRKITILQHKLFKIKGFSTSTEIIKSNIAKEHKKQQDIAKQLSSPRISSWLIHPLKADLFLSQQKSNTLSTELPRLEKQMEIIKQGFAPQIEQEKQLLKQVEDANLEIKSNTQEKEELIKENQSLNESMKKLLVLKQAQEEQITKLEEDKQKLKDQQQYLLSEQPKIENNYTYLAQELDSVSKKHKSIESDLNKAEKEILDSRLKITTLEQERSQKQSLINEKTYEYKKHLTTYEDSEYKLKVNTQKIKDKKLDIYVQEEIMSHKTTEKSNLENLIKKSKKELQKLNTLKTQTIAVQNELQKQINASADLSKIPNQTTRIYQYINQKCF